MLLHFLYYVFSKYLVYLYFSVMFHLLIFANSCCGFILQGILFTLLWTEPMCLKLLLSQVSVDFLLPWTLCESVPWNISCSTGCLSFVLFFFCFLQSCKCPKGVDKDLRFHVTTVRELYLCSLFLHFLEITEDSTTILVIQFPVSWTNERWDLDLGLLSSQVNWL